jgi:hypothetical protein
MFYVYLFLIGVILLFIFFYPRTTIKFYDVEYLLNVINQSGYIDTLTFWNLKTRDSINPKHYFSKIKLYTRKPKNKEKVILYNAAKEADKILRKNGFPDIAVLYWKIYIFNNIEGNMPHTHGSFIMIPEGHLKKGIHSLVSTLIHEKVHVYQRLYPKENMKIAKKYGFNITEPETLPYHILERVRSNPDTNSTIYIWKNRYIPLYLFNSNAETLRDASLHLYDIKKEILTNPREIKYFEYLKNKLKLHESGDYVFEHPNEISAYFIEKKCSKDIFNIVDI